MNTQVVLPLEETIDANLCLLLYAFPSMLQSQDSSNLLLLYGDVALVAYAVVVAFIFSASVLL